MMLSTLRVALLGLFLETILNGAYIILSVASVQTMLSSKPRYGWTRRDGILLGASAAMFALAIIVRCLHTIVPCRSLTFIHST